MVSGSGSPIHELSGRLGRLGLSLYAQARRAGRAVLAGSDPLPFAGEEDLAGTYHCTFEIPAPADPARLVAPLKAALAAGGGSIRFGGRRGAPLAVFRRLRRNAQEKKQP